MKATSILSFLVALSLTPAFAAPQPDLVAKVAAGEIKEARASWWGFEPQDSTRFLQAAIDSRVPRLIVDRMSSPWVVKPLRGVSNQELFFEPGAVVEAKRGEYQSPGDCLLTFRACENIRLVGPGATLRMQHADYMKPPYRKSEWRHALNLLSCRNVLVEGLVLASSGGDGIYVGSTGGELPRCVDVVIRDVTCRDNHRQGISVITADNLLIENTLLCDTHGTPPAAGIDFEPNHPNECLRNCVMRNCRAENNEGCGYTAWTGHLTATSTPVDIRFENCTSTGNRHAASFAWNSRSGRDVGGCVTLRNCRFGKARSPQTVDFRVNNRGTLKYDIADCSFVQTNAAGAEVIVRMDTAWCKANIASEADADIELLPTPCDLAKARVADLKPGQQVRLQPIKLRHSGTYLVYADRARTLRFAGHQIRVGRYQPATKPIRVFGPNGKPVAQMPLPGYDDTAFSFAAPAPSFYRLELALGSGAFQLTTADAPIAIDARDCLPSLIASTGSLWFDVPPRTAKLVLFAHGDGVERVHAQLADANGRIVWDRDNISAWAKFARDRPAPGLWKLSISRPSDGCFEDSGYSLAGVPGFLFLSPDKTWSFR